MELKDRIIENLERLKVFFYEHNEKDWEQGTNLTIQQLKENKIDTKTILHDFIGAGMGSLIDLYICKENGHILKQNEIETNKQLSKLIEEILMIKHVLDRK